MIVTYKRVPILSKEPISVIGLDKQKRRAYLELERILSRCPGKLGADLGDQKSRQEHAHTYFRDRLTRRLVEEVASTPLEYGQDDAHASLQGRKRRLDQVSRRHGEVCKIWRRVLENTASLATEGRGLGYLIYVE
jgi:hypothetical protein